ncbi:hypothetical protein [Kribbella sp. NPDC051770]|uniref:hypothetical protein n=1 Tax=Kribbella sp. NPDC051770 TaxID=3155413 RepID=UPI00344464B4
MAGINLPDSLADPLVQELASGYEQPGGAAMVVLVRGEGKWTPATLTSWASEAELQEVLCDSPELMPGCEGAVVVTEFRIPSVGAVDLVCVHDTGAISLVECKLAKNPEIRRSVVGQIFAYASGMSEMSRAEFGQEFAGRCGRSLADVITEAAGPDFSVEDFEVELTKTLAKGRFRLIIVVDQITTELRAIVEYLNLHLAETVTIIALELGRVLAGDSQVLVPRTYGAEVAERRDRVAGVKRRWTRGELDEAISQIGDSKARQFVESVLAHAKDRGAVVNGGSGPVPSAGIYYPQDGKRRSVVSVYADADEPILSVNVAAIKRGSDVRAQRVLAALRRSATFSDKLPADDETAVTKFPWVRAADLAASADELAAYWDAIQAAIEDEPEAGTPTN